MIIYEATVNEFIEGCKDPGLLASEIRLNLKEKFGISPAENEQRSWMLSLPNVARLLNESKKDLRKVLIEFNIPTTKKRIDFLILGKKENGSPSAWVLELKQWSGVTEVEWNEFRVGRYVDSHPSSQAIDYQFKLQHEMGLADKVDIKSSAYLHNMKNSNSVLFKDDYKDMLTHAMSYTSDDESDLAKLIDTHTFIRDASETIEFFKSAKWAPTKKFKELISEEFKSLKLSGSQKIIFDKIERFVRERKKDEKMTFLISGDPGSGKTIIALKLMLLLTKELNMNLQLMLPGEEVRNAFKDSMKDSILHSKFSGSVVRKGYDAAIIDEAHKAVARDTGLINYQKIFEKLNFAIVLIDNDQVINRKGIEKYQVEEIAKFNGHKVYTYEIEENFRNGGERILLDWISTTLYNKTIINGEFEYSQDAYINNNANYKFKTYKTEDAFITSYKKYWSDIGETRMTRLWDKEWHYGSADDQGELAGHMKMGDMKFAWNPNPNWWKKLDAIDKKTYNKALKKYASSAQSFLIGNPKINYVAYFNHIQGFEFDNIFVYLPDVFTYKNGEIIFHRDRLAKEVKTSQTWSPTSTSKELAGRNPYTMNKRYFLNRVKVMLTRGTKSTHLFVEDEALRKYINSKVKN